MNFSRNQIDIILSALDNSCKYADSEYIEEVNTIVEELSITRELAVWISMKSHGMSNTNSSNYMIYLGIMVW